MPDIAVYDAYKYDYSKYWKSRQYEHLSEVNVLKRLSRNIKRGKWFIDVGGSYGRLLDVIGSKFEYKILFDYSIIALQQAQKRFKQRKDIFYIAGNLYNMPFVDNAFDVLQMVRVFHHIEEPATAIKSLSRITRKNMIIEFANQKHLLNRIRAIFKPHYKQIYKKKFINVYKGMSPEGTKNKDRNIFLNFNPSYIKQLLQQNNLKIQNMMSMSMLRQEILKKLLPVLFLLVLENIWQTLFSKLMLGPSVFVMAYKPSLYDKNTKNDTIWDILRCPKCLGKLDKKLKCTKCQMQYSNKNGILDLRYPIITK